ncbi:serine hydrolase domain-containing protein [Flavobacterium gawalongense]|uniref:Beta-lactamase family protein n=1 Tax=Flavobacterium gawalongense TaxID=2594432 RepID=A0A553BW42_9FLAO|nr:serine hydrolase domain-containing protein [Flavobacterium gawalongense]TRX02046.1 beta-lactamase family protein [Flavobacterium gawalongense]TRX06574.1 beta-lactamase family protein [Flavobacterium gawalongense]TRX12497.1 beta-lactamase family protein [Flavobacterium gawalongense]TRX12682.1 beta-lactamase family protein [Flavobacterium gawalongense]TRX30529.1 beta-lactamase family protein [Flavobacterium gawalongense]
MIKKALVTMLLSLIFSTTYSQKLDVTKLDSLFKALDEKNMFMGSIAVSKNGNLIYSKSIGKADIATNKSLSLKTKYRIGSTTKMFTSALVLKAIEKNRITLNQTIDKFFPTIENSEKITIENLLKHRSGIADFLGADGFANGYTEAKSEEEMIDIISKLKSDFSPNSKAVYSNSNYYLLSIILEKIYAKSYQELLDEQIIKPLKLRNTYFGGKINLQNNECYSYYFSDKWGKEAEGNTSVPLGAGGIVSNPSDLTIFIEKLFKGEIITLKSLKEMTQIQDKFGMGIFELPFYGKKGFVHRGKIDEFRTVLCFFPKEKLAIAITSNGMVYEPKKIIKAILSNYFDKPFKTTFNNIVLKTEELDDYLGEYSSPDYPSKIAITKNNTTLSIQSIGQSSFSVEPTEKDQFENIWEGIQLQFKPNQNQLIYEEGGKKFTLSKQTQNHKS